jgi:hypothetical protein
MSAAPEWALITWNRPNAWKKSWATNRKMLLFSDSGKLRQFFPLKSSDHALFLVD